MHSTIVLAKISGIMCLLIGLSILNKKAINAVIDEMLSSKAMFWLAGFLAAMIGVIMMAFHHTWEAQWTIILTILGWLALLKGLTIMLFPNWLILVYRKIKLHSAVAVGGVIILLVGLVLLFFSFGY